MSYCMHDFTCIKRMIFLFLSGRGENIVFLDTNGLDPTGTEVTKHWYNQQKAFDYNKPRWRKGTKYFQVLNVFVNDLLNKKRKVY